MSEKNISNKVADGVAWMVGLRFSLKALGIVSTMVLARLLTPEDFGVVAIVMSFYALLLLFKNFGFDTVIIQMHSPERRHYDTAWTFNFIFGLALAALLFLAADSVAVLYNVPEIKPVLWVVASFFIIGGFESVGTLDFRKELTFEKEFKLRILPKLIGMPATLLLAFSLRSYWALVIGTLITHFFAVFIGYVMHDYRPRFSFSAAKELFNFSKWLFINNILYFVNNRSPELIIGKIINPQAAGYFSVANEIATVFTSELSSAISRASYPGYAKVSDNIQALSNLYLNVIGASAFFLIPMGLGVASLSNLIVPVFLGGQWMEIIPMLEVMAISGVLIAVNSNAGYVFMAMGNPKMSTFIGTTRVIIFIPLLIYLTFTDGLMGVAWALLTTSIIMFFVINTIVLLRLSIRVRDIGRILYRPTIGTLMMVLCLVPVSTPMSNLLLAEELLYLTLGVLSGGATYFFVVYVLWWLAGKPTGVETKMIAAVLQQRIRIKKWVSMSLK